MAEIGQSAPTGGGVQAGDLATEHPAIFERTVKHEIFGPVRQKLTVIPGTSATMETWYARHYTESRIAILRDGVLDLTHFHQGEGRWDTLWAYIDVGDPATLNAILNSIISASDPFLRFNEIYGCLHDYVSVQNGWGRRVKLMKPCL
jgi:hypothetical protein